MHTRHTVVDLAYVHVRLGPGLMLLSAWEVRWVGGVGVGGVPPARRPPAARPPTR